MLIIGITGIRRWEEACHFLIADLKTAVAGIKELGVSSEEVRIYVFDSTQEDRTEVIAVVTNLARGEVRDPEVQQRLVDVVYEELKKFIQGSRITYVSGITVLPEFRKDGYRSERIHW